jgi:pyruvate,orthophosphate dikinase
MVGKLFLTGAGYPALSAGALVDVPLTDLHRLALRGSLTELDPGIDGGLLEKVGLAVSTPAGWMLTEAGTARHGALLARERAGLDLAALTPIYERFLAANGPFKELNIAWPAADTDTRWGLIGKLTDLVRRVEPALRRTSEILPRFGGYAPRLQAALDRVERGEFDWVAAPQVDSVHTVWMELHEDFLQTMGRSREEEGSY